MASALVRSAFYSLSHDNDYVKSKEMEKIRSQADRILNEIVKDENMDLYDRFAGLLYETLESVVMSCMPLSSAGSRHSLWVQYHKKRSNDLVDMWNQFMKDLNITDSSILLTQMINDKLFEDLVKHHTTTSVEVDLSKSSKKQLSSLEESIIRYATGYVPHTLIKQFESRKDKKYAVFVDCLLSMSATCEDSVECSFFDYTKRWTELINRGGLFEINDQSFRLFKEIESTLQMKLQSAMLESAKAVTTVDRSYKHRIISEVTSDDDVLFYWSLCAVQIINEQESTELLTQIVELWLTIRGFSLANEWLEQFKQKNSSTTSKSKGLRRSLKYSN